MSQSIKVNAGIDGHDDLIAGMSGQVLMEPPPVLTRPAAGPLHPCKTGHTMTSNQRPVE